MKKNIREYIVIDELTKQLVNALSEKSKSEGKKISKGELYRQSMYKLAKEKLTEEEFETIVKHTMENEII